MKIEDLAVRMTHLDAFISMEHNHTRCFYIVVHFYWGVLFTCDAAMLSDEVLPV